MVGKYKVLVSLFLAGLLLTALIPASVYSRQEEIEQESRLEKVGASDRIHAAEKEAAAEKQEKEKAAGVESRPAEEEAAEESIPAEETPAQKTEPAGGEEVETIVPAPKNVKEAMASYVFLGWMWLSIFVLIYFLCLKVKETDRILQLKFFSKERD